MAGRLVVAFHYPVQILGRGRHPVAEAVDDRQTCGDVLAVQIDRAELDDGIRSCAHGHYVIFFEATAEAVLVVRVLHGARDLPAVFRADEK